MLAKLDDLRCPLRRLLPERAFAWLERWGAVTLLLAAFLTTLVLWIFEPIPHGHSYHLGVKVSFLMLLLWFLAIRGRAWFDARRLTYFVVFALGIWIAADRLMNIQRDSELLHTYETLFQTLDAGQDPYQGDHIYHRAEYDAIRYGNFNYPPLEIWPYRLAATLSGQWNADVFTVSVVCIQALVLLLLFLSLPEVAWWKKLAFAPLILFFEIRTNVAMSFLFVALALFVLSRKQAAPWQRPALWLICGLGLLTKFILIPLTAALLYSGFRFGKWRQWRDRLLDGAMIALVAVLACWPFNFAEVWQETIVFNLNMKTRGALTTFYPNVFSGLLSWLDLSALFPLVAVGVLGLTILHLRRLDRLSAAFAAMIAFMLLSTTPEPQYIPVLIYTALIVAFTKRREERAAA